MNLNYMNLDILEGQLARGEHLDDLLRVDGGKYPHWDILQSYMLSDDVVLRERWAACLFKLIDLKAPIDLEPWGWSHMCVASALVHKRWDPQVELTRELARKYIEVGYLDMARPLVGGLPAPEDQDGFCSGKLPLAAAIGYDNPDAVRFFCENGASWNIGPVCEGGLAREALEYAQARGADSSAAVLVELAMRERLDAAPAAAAGAVARARARRAGL
jgi:hypothetical protein